jgi:hypothetical protein
MATKMKAQGHITIRRRPNDGEDGVAYAVRLSSSQVIYSAVDGSVTSGNLTFSVTRTEGKTIELIQNAAQAKKYGLSIYVYLDDSKTSTTDLLAVNVRTLTVNKLSSVHGVSISVSDTTATIKVQEKFALLVMLNGTEIDRQYVTLVADAQEVADGVKATGIDISEGTITLYADSVVFANRKDGTVKATFNLFNDDGYLNIGIINVDELSTNHVKCKRHFNKDESTGLSAVQISQSTIISAINRLDDGAFETFHAMKLKRSTPNGVGESLSYEENPSLRIVTEEITINGTTYTAYIQAFDTDGTLVGALTNKGWITPASDAVTYTPIQVAVKEGSLITEAQAMLLTEYNSVTYYRIKSSSTDTNGKITTKKDTSGIITATSANIVMYSPTYMTKNKLSTSGTALTTDGPSDSADHSRTRYTIYTNGAVVVDTFIFN